MADEPATVVRRALEELLGADDSIGPTSRLGADLDLDELDLVELVMLIEEELDVVISDDQIEAGGLIGSAEPASTGRTGAGGVIQLSSRYMEFDLPQQYLSLENTVAEFVEIVRRITEAA